MVIITKTENKLPNLLRYCINNAIGLMLRFLWNMRLMRLVEDTRPPQSEYPTWASSKGNELILLALWVREIFDVFSNNVTLSCLFLLCDRFEFFLLFFGEPNLDGFFSRHW